MAATDKGSPHDQQNDRRLVIQLDYTCVSAKGLHGESTGQQAILTLIDVRNQLATAIIVPQKAINSYATTETKRFLYDVGRTNAILQTYAEALIQAASKELDRHINDLSMRIAHTGSSNNQGPVGRYRQTLHALVRTIRLSLAASYKIDKIETQSSRPIMTGLTRLPAWQRNHYTVHDDGIAIYQR